MGTFVTYHNDYAANTANTSLSPSLSTSVASGNLLIAMFAFDNNDLTSPTISTISRPTGETNSWSLIGHSDSHTATAGGGVRCEIWAIVTSTVWPSGTISANMSAQNGGFRMVFLAEFSGFYPPARASASASGAGGGASLSAGTVSAGSLVIGFMAQGWGVNSAAAGDSDTNGGVAWSTVHWKNVGNAGLDTSLEAQAQYKIPTSTAAQTYDSAPQGAFGQVVVVLGNTIGQSVAVVTDTETDAAVPLGKRKVKASLPSTETGVAVPVGRKKTKALAPAVEVDSAPTLGAIKGRHIVAATVLETDAAQTIQASKRKSLPLASETSVAQALTRVKLRPLTTTAETQAAIPFGVIDLVRYWRFEPPTYEKAFDWPLLTHGPRFHLDQALSVIRSGGVLRTIAAPSQDQLVAAGVEGVDWFRGGHIYIVGKAVADDLIANGFTVTFDHEG